MHHAIDADWIFSSVLQGNIENMTLPWGSMFHSLSSLLPPGVSDVSTPTSTISYKLQHTYSVKQAC